MLKLLKKYMEPTYVTRKAHNAPPGTIACNTQKTPWPWYLELQVRAEALAAKAQAGTDAAEAEAKRKKAAEEALLKGFPSDAGLSATHPPLNAFVLCPPSPFLSLGVHFRGSGKRCAGLEGRRGSKSEGGS